MLLCIINSYYKNHHVIKEENKIKLNFNIHKIYKNLLEDGFLNKKNIYKESLFFKKLKVIICLNLIGQEK